MNTLDPTENDVFPQVKSAWGETLNLGDLAALLIDRLNAQGLQPSPGAKEVASRLHQLQARLATAANHLHKAKQLLMAAHHPFDIPTADRKAQLIQGGAAHIRAAREECAPLADMVVEAAERLAREHHRQGRPPVNPTPPVTLSSTQISALRAVAQGRVDITRVDGPVHVRCRGGRVSYPTLRALERRQLVHRDPVVDEEDVVLTREGAAVLAATSAQPPPSTPRPALSRAPAPPKSSTPHTR
ncbi:hypothetical protein [Streptomyces sp. WZ-12]|uniref:hypothetical protein n=1 Tax=Streptomyces sp. WZ-12 TaxID=3030210 RepID=UPI0023813CDD|nr:hypothetical protein [Streptomyces sp. WZ-12]